MAENTTDIVAKNDNLPPVEKRWSVLKVPAVLVSCTVNSVSRMPDLKEPVFDPDYLPERAGAITSVLYSWSYNYRKLEYAVDPFGKGFMAWVRLFLALGFFIGLPVAAMVGLCWGTVIVLSRLCGVAEGALALIKSISLLLLGVIGVALLGYLAYFVVMVLMAKPVSLPKFIFVGKEATNDDGASIES